MPTWVNILLTCFYVVWLFIVLGLLFVIWRNGVRRAQAVEQSLIESARESAHAAMLAAEAVTHLVAQRGEETSTAHVHTD